jgi:hypothetical protein
MTRDEIIKLFREVAKERGYSCSDARAWRRIDELCGLVELDRTNWRERSPRYGWRTAATYPWLRCVR